MNLLIKGVTIADPNSPFHLQVCNVRLQHGQIKAIDSSLPSLKDETVMEARGAFMSPGFFDLNCEAGDPGFETREDLQTLVETANAGGFTGLAVLPQTSPVVQSKSGVNYLLNKVRDLSAAVYPIGALSDGLEGKELAELYDMRQAGAVAFSDGDHPVKDDGFMSRAMQYAQGLDSLVMVYPENSAMAGKAQVNESKTSVLLGMKGIPALAEEMQISRDLFLMAYHDCALHFSTISTAGSVALIKKAKKEGLKVTCDVAAHHLVFTEELLLDFDSQYKVKPPLRDKNDVKALLNGLKEGTIDAVVSQHRPHEVEFKNVEFEIAKFGISALQTVLPLLLKAGLNPAQIAEKLAIRPRQLVKLAVPVINAGELADLVVYHPEKEWEFNGNTNCSKSVNSPLFGKVLKGKVLFTSYHQHFHQYE